MANEFIARKGLIVLENGVKVTGSSTVFGDITASGNIKATEYFGSGKYLTDVTASYVDFSNVVNKPTLVSASSQIDHDATTNFVADEHVNHSSVFINPGDGLSGGGNIAANVAISLNTSSAHFTGGVKTKLNADGVVSSSAQIDVRQTTGIATLATTGSNTFVGNQIISGSLITTADTMNFNGAMTISGSLTITGSITNTQGGFTGSFSGDGSGLTGIAASTVDFANITNKPALVSASAQIDHDTTTNFVANEHIDHSTVSITAGNGLVGGGDITSTRTLTVDTGSSHFTDGVKAKLNTENVVSSSGQIKAVLNTEDVHSGSYLGTATTSNLPEGTNLYYLDSRVKDKLNLDGVVSSSAQVDVRQTTGIATIATTGSNTFTGTQHITNTTNSTNYADGALIVDGGVGIGKDVNISGSLTVLGILTAVTTSIQYVTSSQVSVGANKVVVNTNDVVRFGGLSVIDSGSTYGTGSLLWDSLNNRWIYQAFDQNYNSAVLIAGPKNYGDLGNESGLVAGRVPVATGDDHIDTNAASSSIYIDFATKQTFIEAGLYVTGAISSSVGFYGDGSNLTGVVSNLSITGSQGGQDSINLKTQGLTVTGENGINATVSGQTLTISGSNATTTSKGVASFTGSNFTVTGGEVSAKPITFNGTSLDLGGTYAFGLQNITSQGASTTDHVTFTNGITSATVLHTASLSTGIIGPVTNQVVATIATGSYVAAHFSYVVSDGSNLRTGTVMTIWNGSNIEFTDTSTNDIGDTTGANFGADTSLGNVRLKFSVPSGTWTVKTSIQAF